MRMQCPQCQHDNPLGAEFCVECASSIERRCPGCGTEAAPTAKFCPECAAPPTVKSPAVGRATGQSSAPTEAGERRHLTALFCDLVGSTDIASRLDPEEWHRISKAYQEAAAAAVTRFGGHVDKFSRRRPGVFIQAGPPRGQPVHIGCPSGAVSGSGPVGCCGRGESRRRPGS